MYIDEFNSVNPNIISTATDSIPVKYAWRDTNRNLQPEANELDAETFRFTPRSNTIDPNLRDPKNDEIMFAYQRELMSNVSFNVELDPAVVQRSDGGSGLLRFAVRQRAQIRSTLPTRTDGLRPGQHPEHGRRSPGDVLRRQAGVSG